MIKYSVAKGVGILFVFCAGAAIGTLAQTNASVSPAQKTAVPPTVTFATLHSFDDEDGRSPFAGLVQGTDGNLYGTAPLGGDNGGGTVFKITPSGTLTTLYSFCIQAGCPDGEFPGAGLVLGTYGKLYGTTYIGGANGGGTVFSITAAGTLTTLYSFCSQAGCPDGEYPAGGLVQGTNGKFYGTTSGGASNNCGGGCGTVFSITAGGTLTTLHSFDGTDGDSPQAGLAQGTNGKFYGTTYLGGASNDGVVFSMTAGGTLTTLRSFDGTDGDSPYAGLVQGTDGDFYGTTAAGGAHSNGTVFKITPRGALTTLYSFCPHTGCADGSSPYDGLVQGTDGNFYGTTGRGGANGYGTVFSVTAGGRHMTLYSFCSQSNCTDGESPYAGLVQDTNGTFYGTTEYGGTGMGTINDGTVFSISVGLGPFVETNPVSAAVGKAVTILGTSLTGSSSVTFNGTAAAFTVVSSSEINATVPTGATTGTVQVLTPGGTLSSNVPFRVLP